MKAEVSIVQKLSLKKLTKRFANNVEWRSRAYGSILFTHEHQERFDCFSRLLCEVWMLLLGYLIVCPCRIADFRVCSERSTLYGLDRHGRK